MKKNIRSSNTKKSKMSGFRYRNKTKGGKKVIARRRQKGSTV
ncbi:MAG: 50S ribosomal protein L34 [Planctomycetota bacterium]